MKAQRTSERVQGRGRVVGGARGGRAKCYNFKPDSHALFSDEYRSLSVFASSFPPPPLFSFPFSFSFSFRSSSASLEPYESRSKSAPEISPNFRTVSFDDIEIDPPKVSNYFVTEGNRLNRVTLREEGYERMCIKDDTKGSQNGCPPQSGQSGGRFKKMFDRKLGRMEKFVKAIDIRRRRC